MLEFVTGSTFSAYTIAKHNDPFRSADGGQTVRNADACYPKRLHCFVDALLRGEIQSTGGLVHEENPRVMNQGSGDRHSLSLPS